MNDGADDKARNSFRQAHQMQSTYDELRKRLKVYPSGPAPDKPEPEDDKWDMEASALDGRIRGLYKEMLDDPIPNKMLELIRKLADKENKS